MTIGYIGLGKMGKNMVLRLLEQGIEVVAWNRSSEPVTEVADHGAVATETIAELLEKLPSPRVIWLMLPQGDPTTELINKLKPGLQKGDLLIDGANGYYQDTQGRASELHELGVGLMDVGVSGGPDGARQGACLMIGGKQEDFTRLTPLFTAAAAPQAFAYLGPVGAGHFAKMVHNGIEYGMMEAIAEGAAVIKTAPFELNLAEVFRLYNQKSVIESRLVGWAHEALAEDDELTNISATIGHTGEGEWTIKEAHQLQVPVPVIETSFQVRVNSAQDEATSAAGFRNKVVSALRGKFGHHPVTKD